ncbi:MAG: phosphotransferase family protein [Actinomycetota bacterium]|nr:phosphotransferase family protein [Acidimicrobiales bacterium]
MSDTEPPVIAVDRVSSWIGNNAEVDGALTYSLIAGGRSNMTFTVSDNSGVRFVLRRPPTGKLLPSAHDMAREYRLMHSLRGTEVPVPEMVGLCQDESVNGRDFYVMNYVDGIVVRDVEIGSSMNEGIRRKMSESLIDTLCALHRVDIDHVGLGDLAKRNGYIERQIKRWSGQWESSRTRDIPLVDSVARELLVQLPEPSPTTIAHGDYRLSNCMFDSSGSVIAVLDWELCTLGEPMADLAGLLGYWYDENSDDELVGDAATTQLLGFMSQDELAARYVEEMGIPGGSVDYYRAFAEWRLACIGEGVYSRYLGGQQGIQSEEIDLEQMQKSVTTHVEKAAKMLQML